MINMNIWTSKPQHRENYETNMQSTIIITPRNMFEIEIWNVYAGKIKISIGTPTCNILTELGKRAIFFDSQFKR